MKVNFVKYQGAGNDFILVDNRTKFFNHNRPRLLEKLCDRRFGIGADGIMFLEEKEGYDFEMVYYNADGNLSSMCGNGGRCIVAFAKRLNLIKEETNFLAVDGPHYAKISDTGTWVSLQMIDVNEIKTDGNAYVLNTGSPHYIALTDNLKDKDVFNEGRNIRYNESYKAAGINVNFVEDFKDFYFVRTYERGVEDETYACGTGVTAAALAMAKHKDLSGNISTPVKALGGDLNIRFRRSGESFSEIYLEGPAVFVYQGEIEVDNSGY